MADTSLIQFDALDAASTLADTDQTLVIQQVSGVSTGRRASLSQLRSRLVRAGNNVSISPDGVINASSATWLNSSGVPSNGTGVDYDYNLDVVTGNVYQKTLGVWNLIGSIGGRAGSTGTVTSNAGATVGTTGNTLTITPGATSSDPVVFTRSGTGAIQFSHPVSLSSTLVIAGTTTAAAITASGTITGNGAGTGLVIANAATIGTTLAVGGTTTLLSSGVSPLTIANETVSSIVGVALTVPSGHEMALRVPNGSRLRVGVAGSVSALIVQPNTGLNTPGAASPNTVTVGNVLSAVAYQTPAATYDLTGKSSVHAVSNLAMGWNTTGATYAGTTADALHQLAISADTADITPDAATGAGVLMIQHTVGGGAARGARVPFRVALTQAGAIGVRGDMLHAIGKFTSSWAYSQGGTDLTTGAVGTVHTLRPQITLNSGATNYARVSPWGEAGLAIRSGASVRDATGIGVTLLAAHRSAASRDNIVFAIDGEATAVDGVGATPTWKQGIAFGTQDRRWAMASTAELIAANFQTNNGDGAAQNVILPPPLATRGVAFGNVNFSQQSGHSIHVPGASIDGTGQFRSANLFIKQVSGGIEIDIPLSKVSAVSVSTAGTGAAGVGNYYPNDILYAELTPGVRSQYRVTNTKVLNARVVSGGGSGTPGTVTVTGTTGTGTKFQASGIISAGGVLGGNQVLSVVVVAGGTGGTPGAVTLTGTTGTGTKFEATGTINGSGVLTGALTVTVGGAYTVAPTNVAAEPVTGGGLTGATVSLVMVPTVTVVGNYTVNPTNTAVEPVTGGGLVGATVSLGVGLLTVSVLVPDVSAAAPGTITVSGGSGSGAVLAPTWAAANTLSLNTSGGLTEVVGSLAVGRSSGTSSIIKLIGDGTADRVIEWYTGSARKALLRTPPVTQVISATVVSGGSGGTNGAVTVTGTTGTGTKFQATGTISGGALAGALTITVQGNYSVLPTNVAVEPVTGGGLTGATVSLVFSQRFQTRMYNQSGGAPETMVDIRRNLGTLADPHIVYFGPDLTTGTDAINVDVRGNIQARTFSTYSSHYPAMTLANTAAVVPPLAIMKSNYSGVTTTPGYYVGMGSNDDSVALLTGGSLDYLNIAGVLTAGYNGGRTGIDASVSELADTQQINDSRGMIGGKFSHNASNNVGGIAAGFGVDNNFGWGNIYAANLQATLNAGATYRRSLVGMEIDMMAVAGTSYVSGQGLLVTLIGDHATQPMRDWSAITVSNASAAADKYAGRFKTIFAIGNYGSAFPGAADGVLMHLTGGSDYVNGPAQLAKGFHFREAIFTGQIMQWDGGELSQGTYGGELQIGYTALTGTSTGASLDVSRFKTATVAIGSTPGTGYWAGALVKTAGDVYVKIASVVTKTITGITAANPPIVTSNGHGLANGTVFDATNVVGMTQVNSQTIASVTNANPGVFTRTGHGLPNGARVRLSGFGSLVSKTSMYQLSGNPYYVVANRANDTFTLNYPSGVAVDTTSFGVYTGGGTITISYRVANATANTFELQTAEGGAINASGWTAYSSGGHITTTIPDIVEMYRAGYTASGAAETNVATEALVRTGRSYGSGLTVNLTKTGASVLAIQGSGGATTVGGTLGVTSTTPSTSSTTGALTVAGGLGVAGAIYAGSFGPITINTASNGTSGTATPTGLVVSDSANGSGWDITNPWAMIQFTSADASTSGPGGRVRIGPVAETTNGGASRLAIFQAATANTWVERWALTSTGRMLVGGVPADDGVHTIQATGSIALNLNATTAPGNLSGTVFRATQADASAAYLLVDTFAGQGYLAFRRANTTNASPTALASGSVIGAIVGRGHDGTAYSGERVRIQLRADEAWSGAAHGTAIVLSTTTAGSTTMVDRMVVDSAGVTTFGASGNTIAIAPNTSSSTVSTITGGGSGGIGIATSGGTQFQVLNTTSAINYVTAKGGATGTGATISSAGAESNINLILTAKGTGVLSFTSPVSATTISATGTVTLTGTGSSTQANGGVLLKTSNNSNAVPVFRSQGRRSDANLSIGFSGQFVAEHVRTDALPTSGQVLGGLVFGGNVDLSETMTYPASVTAEADGAWVDANNAPTALDFFTGSTGQNLSAANITHGTRRMRITSSGLVGINTGTGTPLGRVHVSETSAAASGTTSIIYAGGTQTVANTGSFIGLYSRPQYTAASGNTLTNLYGAHLNPENSSTGTVTALFGAFVFPANVSSGAVTTFAGVYASPVNSGTGAVGSMYGLVGVPTNSGAATVTNAYGLFVRIDNTHASGVITTAYGVLIQTPNNSGTITTRYGIYQQDTAGSNVLGAPTVFGISGNTLTVTPNASSSTAIALAGGGSGGMTFAASGGVQLAVTNTASAVNYVGITGGSTGNGVTVSALGSDTNIHLILDAKGGGVVLALDHVNLASGKVLQSNGTQVVGARDTGWTAMTGTTNKATAYDTSTVTLAQLAGRVMAIQAAITTHGLLGA